VDQATHTVVLVAKKDWETARILRKASPPVLRFHRKLHQVNQLQLHLANPSPRMFVVERDSVVKHVKEASGEIAVVNTST
jgi:hypothetical protein